MTKKQQIERFTKVYLDLKEEQDNLEHEAHVWVTYGSTHMPTKDLIEKALNSGYSSAIHRVIEALKEMGVK